MEKMMNDKLEWQAQLYWGDCLEVMRDFISDNSIDTIITDPPYGLEFMGKNWDQGVPGLGFWAEMLRVAKPGSLLLAMGGTRTFHRLVCAIEDAGWEVKDTMLWLYGQGFPKSQNLSRLIDKHLGKEPEVIGRRTDGRYAHSFAEGTQPLGNLRPRKSQVEKIGQITRGATPEARLWDGWGTALKPAHEPICVAMKPRDGTYANNALKWGVAGYWIEGGKVQDSTGKERLPANILQDGSEEVLEGLPGKARRFFYCAKASRSEREAGLQNLEEKQCDLSRNAHQSPMNGGVGNSDNQGVTPVTNHHPTVKPLALMKYLVRLTRTPTGGVVLDPFMGSGTTGIACVKENRDFIGIESVKEYYELAQQRIEHAQDLKKSLR